MKKLLFLFISATITFAQNPIVPPGVYIADPAAHVWPDGKLYIYGSLDESTEYYCSWRHHVMQTDDLQNWQILENRFASQGEQDAVDYNNSLLFAPDCMYKNGVYYLYYCQPDPQHAEGVATADNPTGPFSNGKPMNIEPYNQIDPCTFIDDDGQAYYVWGQFTMKMARLQPNMQQLDVSSMRDSVLTESEHFFHEGAFMTKRNGIYYLVYADMSRAGMPTCLGYATATSPIGPYTYRGVIIDNDHCDPGNWNNHGSIAEFNGQWYVFYHRATHNSQMLRKACVEPIHFLADGSIPEVQMTSQGAGAPLLATDKIDAARACSMLGKVRITRVAPQNEALTDIAHDDRAVFKYINFGDGVSRVHICLKPGDVAGTLALRQDMPWGKKLADIHIAAAPATWTIISADIDTTQGVHALWLQFWSDDGSSPLNWQVDWLQFE